MDYKMLVRFFCYWLVGLGICALITLFTGCKQVEYVPVETVRTEVKTEYIEKTDSVHDSIWVSVVQRGDTIFETKYKERFKYVFQHDTVNIEKVDTVRVVVKQPSTTAGAVTKYKTPWTATVLIWVLLALVVVMAAWIVKKKIWLI